MNSKGHKMATKVAFEIMEDIYGILSSIQNTKNRGIIIDKASQVDYEDDLESIDVDYGMDDPHHDTWADQDDHARHKWEGYNFTAFNHFIDIKKGGGRFDDFDGYSYNHGSASKQQYQDSDEVVSGWWEKFLAGLAGGKVDEDLNTSIHALGDEYIHAPGQKWYRNCSPSIERYSYYYDKKVFDRVTKEAQVRFPQGKKGIASSVFMPVDNMARYWYYQFKVTRSIHNLGFVMHAIQDVSIPHHSAGYMGNWHGNYENDVDLFLARNGSNKKFRDQIKKLVQVWDRDDKNIPTHLNPNDYQKNPAKNWRIDFLVTWLALNAYKHYKNTFNDFKNGYKRNSAAILDLTQKAIALSVLVLVKASDTFLSLREAASNLNMYTLDSFRKQIVGNKSNASLKKTINNLYLKKHHFKI